MHILKGLVRTLDPRDAGFNPQQPNRRLGEKDIYRYRKQRGVNLGSWFVLEKWITDVPFHNALAPASSDYDVARGPGAKEILEQHWDTWITDEDWKWISERGINAVRIPIGYYHLVARDPAVVKGTPFVDMGHIFQGAWQRIVNAVEMASQYGIGVLLDLHSVPGKQNEDAHSGINGPVEFYKNVNLAHTVYILKLLACAFAATPNVVGIELVNEPQNNGLLRGWYQFALDSLRTAVGPDLPLYIHDAWSTDQYASLIRDRTDFVVLDHHLYRCFTLQDHALSGDQHAAALPHDAFAKYAQMTRGNFVVAEFSAALDSMSFGGRTDAGEQDRQRRVFARAELQMFEQSCAGWWMWTYKKSGWDTGWSFRDSVLAEVMPDWVGRRRSRDHPNTENERNEQGSYALNQHTRYWSAFKGHYEHWRFEVGFRQGWDDSVLFFSFSPPAAFRSSLSELGFKGQWVRRRADEHILDFGNCKCIWEFGQ